MRAVTVPIGSSPYPADGGKASCAAASAANTSVAAIKPDNGISSE
nr:hypothetical protein [Kibdelosporangium aridum]